ncbi:MAG: CotH kinase family protein [Thermoleophilia bacterium]|nr:CotH kinase family protein [Thermoleophilia bacterium]
MTPRSRVRIALAAALAGGATALAAPAAGQPDLRTRLPIVVVDADGPIVDDPKVGARMRIIHDPRGGVNRPGDRASVHNGRIGIEIRGQSSQRFPKKQFGLETVDARGEGRDVSLLGMPADDDWVLYAAYNDATLMRNVVAYRTARWLGRYAARTRFVELVLNGRYWGVYVLMERPELTPGRVTVPTDGPGALLEYTSPDKLDPGDAYFTAPVTGTPVIFDTPDRDDMTDAEAAAISGRVERFERALYGPAFRHPVNGWRAHMNERSMTDYVLLYELMNNHDAFSASTFLHVGRDDRLAMGPLWDFDLSMGNPPSLLRPRGCSLCDRRWASRLYRDPAFVRGLVQRWTSLRRSRLPARMVAAIRRDARALGQPAIRNQRRWPVGVSPAASDVALLRAHRAQTATLARWIRVRAAWLTANLRGVGRR